MQKKRAMSLFLSAALAVSMVPASAVNAMAANLADDNLVATFEPDAIAKGDNAVLHVDFKDVSAYAGFDMIVHWNELEPYVKNTIYDDSNSLVAGFSAQDFAVNSMAAQRGTIQSVQTGGSLKVPGDVINMAASDTNIRYATNHRNGINILEDAAVLTMRLDADIPDGYYDVEVELFDLVDKDGKQLVTPGNQASWQKATATLKVGNLDTPAPPDEQKYDIKLNTPVNGTLALADGQASSVKAGDQVQVKVKPKDANWKTALVAAKDSGGTNPDIRLTKLPDLVGGYEIWTFTMPAYGVTVDANFVAADKFTVASTVTGGHGEVKLNGTEFIPMTNVNFQVIPAPGYRISSVTAVETNGDNADHAVVVNPSDSNQSTDAAKDYTLSMPRADVLITVTMEQKDPGPETHYNIHYGNIEHAALKSHPVTQVKPNDKVQFGIKPDTGYTIKKVTATATNGLAPITVNSGSTDSDGYYLYDFNMPASDVTINVEMQKIGGGDENKPSHDQGIVTGTVNTSNNRPLANATVTLTSVTGQAGAVQITVKTDDQGRFKTDAVPTNLTYKLQAHYDTHINQGQHVDDAGFKNESSVTTITPGDFKGTGAEAHFNLQITLHYKWDVDSDGSEETIFAGADDQFLTPDDNYKDRIPAKGDTGKDVDVFADSNGKINSEKAHYGWDLYPTISDSEQQGGNGTVFVGPGFQAGTKNDFYQFDVDHNPGTANVDVSIGEDGIPATSDDNYVLNINGQPQKEIVYNGADGQAATEDDYYIMDGKTIFAGKDQIAGTADDWYMGDADGHSELPDNPNDDKISVGEDHLAGTNDDYYERDVNGDGKVETIFAGENVTGDGKFNTADDFYVAEVGGKDVHVNPGQPGENGDPVEFGQRNDHYQYDINGKDTTVRVGLDAIAGTADDEWDAVIHDANRDPAEQSVVVEAGADGIPGTADDVYHYDADKDGQDETVFVGEDGLPDTADDHYIKDVNGDGKDETIFAGEDTDFGTKDDHYKADPNKDGTPDNIFAGEDSIIGTPDDRYDVDVNGDGVVDNVYVGDDKIPGTSDDWYKADTDHDGSMEGEHDKVHSGEDGVIGTEDDYYVTDPDHDGDKDNVYVGDDKIPGTSDDWYEHDTNKDGDTTDPEDKVEAGEDGIIGTEDDEYHKDIDKDGIDEDIFVGPDKIPGTSDDWYEHDTDKDGNTDGQNDKVDAGEDGVIGTPDDHYKNDVDKDGTDEDIFVGPDGIPNTPDDWYDKDVDKDGEDEEVHVGPDGKPGTDDDWFYPMITFMAGDGTVNGTKVYTVISSDITVLPSASLSGYTFQGWASVDGSSSVMTLDQVKALRADTTLYAYYTRNSSGGGGGGGGGSHGGGSGPVVSKEYLVDFNSTGGSEVKDQKVVSGHTAVKPNDPVRDGFRFNGWFTDTNCTKIFDFNTKITKDIKLYAGWVKMSNVDENVFGLLTQEHIAYLSGYDDGLVHGGDNITRGQVAMIMYRLLNEDAHAKYDTVNETFKDVASDAWNAKAIATMANAGIMVGYSPDYFGPNDYITRAEFATVCANIGKLQPTYKHSFSDVSSDHWAYANIMAVADNGWVSGFPDGTFGVNKNITRSQVVAMLNRVMKRGTLNDSTFEQFKNAPGFRNWADNLPGAWDYYDLIEAGNAHSHTYDANGVETWTALN